jgi:hypothetical protein
VAAVKGLQGKKISVDRRSTPASAYQQQPGHLYHSSSTLLALKFLLKVHPQLANQYVTASLQHTT